MLKCSPYYHFFPDSIDPEDVPLESTEMTQDQLLSYRLMFPIGQDKSIPWNAITAYENMKAKRISELKKWKEQVGFICKPFRDRFSRCYWFRIKNENVCEILAATLACQYFG